MRVGILLESGYTEFNAGYYLHDHEWTKIIMAEPVADTLLRLKEGYDYDVYFNLCEGYEPPYYTGLEVVKTLEKLNLPFTGADSSFYNPTRERMQAAAESVGVKFARGGRVANVSEAEALAGNLRYPLMVKHPNSFGSTGMTQKSRVENLRELKTQVRRICKGYQSARVEEFIEGREFTVLIVDNPDDFDRPFVYPPAELLFPNGVEFLHSRVKWVDAVYLRRVADPRLARRLRDMTRKVYRALGGNGYARSDIRMSSDGELHMLEINPNSGILYEPEELGPADIMMEYDKGGHKKFIERIFRSAIRRHEMRKMAAIQ